MQFSIDGVRLKRWALLADRHLIMLQASKLVPTVREQQEVTRKKMLMQSDQQDLRTGSRLYRFATVCLLPSSIILHDNLQLPLVIPTPSPGPVFAPQQPAELTPVTN
eukprot:1154229-Pelagomonas_calceolata.AAC.2